MEKYTLMIFALRRFMFWISNSSKVEAEQFLLAADLTPFALHMALQSELFFTDDPAIGIICMVGYETVAADGIMWHEKRFGALYQRAEAEIYTDYQSYRYSILADGYGYAAVADGFLLATAYDLPWNAKACERFHVKYLSWSYDSPLDERLQDYFHYETNYIYLFDRLEAVAYQNKGFQGRIYSQEYRFGHGILWAARECSCRITSLNLLQCKVKLAILSYK